MLNRRETVADRFKKTGYVMGPDHPMAKRNRMQEAKATQKPKAGTVVMAEKESEDARRDAVRAALRERFVKTVKKGAKSNPDVAVESAPWPDEISDDVVIYNHKGTKYASHFSIGKDGKAKLGDAFPVARQYVAV